MEVPLINQTVLMSDANNFKDIVELNVYSDETQQPDTELAKVEFETVKDSLEDAGITVIQRPSPEGCQDGIYTANWAFCLGRLAILSRLPNVRQGEQPYAKQYLRELGKFTIAPPRGVRYSGQGDTLRCGDTIFVGSHYRTDPIMADIIQEIFPDYRVVGVQTEPALENGREVINQVSGWPDSPFYDIDLAMGVVRPGLIAWCPEAFLPESQRAIEALTDIEKIEISKTEATERFASNFVSTGHHVIMGKAPELEAKLRAKGLGTTTLETKQINKAGGFIRCVSLDLSKKGYY